MSPFSLLDPTDIDNDTPIGSTPTGTDGTTAPEGLDFNHIGVNPLLDEWFSDIKDSGGASLLDYKIEYNYSPPKIHVMPDFVTNLPGVGSIGRGINYIATQLGNIPYIGDYVVCSLIINFLWMIASLLLYVAAWCFRDAMHPEEIIGFIYDHTHQLFDWVYNEVSIVQVASISMTVLLTLWIVLWIRAKVDVGTNQKSSTASQKEAFSRFISGSVIWFSIIVLLRNPLVLLARFIALFIAIVKGITDSLASSGSSTIAVIPDLVRTLVNLINYQTPLSPSCAQTWSQAIANHESTSTLSCLTAAQAQAATTPTPMGIIDVILAMWVGVVLIRYAWNAGDYVLSYALRVLWFLTTAPLLAAVVIPTRRPLDRLQHHMMQLLASLISLAFMVIVGTLIPGLCMDVLTYESIPIVLRIGLLIFGIKYGTKLLYRLYEKQAAVGAWLTKNQNSIPLLKHLIGDHPIADLGWFEKAFGNMMSGTALARASLQHPLSYNKRVNTAGKLLRNADLYKTTIGESMPEPVSSGKMSPWRMGSKPVAPGQPVPDTEVTAAAQKRVNLTPEPEVDTSSVEVEEDKETATKVEGVNPLLAAVPHGKTVGSALNFIDRAGVEADPLAVKRVKQYLGDKQETTVAALWNAHQQSSVDTLVHKLNCFINSTLNPVSVENQEKLAKASPSLGRIVNKGVGIHTQVIQAGQDPKQFAKTKLPDVLAKMSRGEKQELVDASHDPSCRGGIVTAVDQVKESVTQAPPENTHPNRPPVGDDGDGSGGGVPSIKDIDADAEMASFETVLKPKPLLKTVLARWRPNLSESASVPAGGRVLWGGARRAFNFTKKIVRTNIDSEP